MQKRKIEQMYQSVCDAFPTGTVRAILSDGQKRLSCERHPGLPEEVSFSAQKEATVITFDGCPYQRISLPLSPGVQLLLYLKSAEYPDIFVPILMLDSLLKLITAKESLTADTDQADELSLLNSLIYTGTVEAETYALLLAARLRKDLSLRRAVCVFAPENGASLKDVSAMILHLIRQFRGTDEQDILGLVGEDRIMLCKALRRSDATIKAQLGDSLEALLTQIREQCGCALNVAVGTEAKFPKDYRVSFQAAVSALRGAQYFSGRRVAFTADHIPELTYLNSDAALLRHFLDYPAALLNQNRDLVPVAEALLRNNMSLAPAAESLFVHRNTVSQYMSRLKSLLRIDPQHRDEDRYFLMLACMHYHESFQRMETPL